MKRKHFLKATIIILLYLSYLVLIPSAHAIITPEKTGNTSENAKYSFVQSAAEATLEVNKAEDNTFTLTLKGVIPYVSYFSERPNRNTGSMPVEKFITLWEKRGSIGFENNPPNADLNGIEILSSNKVLNVVLELTSAQYDPQSKTLTYMARFLKGDMAPLSKSLTLHHVTLFIDDVCLGCW